MKVVLLLLALICATASFAQNTIELTPLAGPEGANLLKVESAGTRLLALGPKQGQTWLNVESKWSKISLPGARSIRDIARLSSSELIALVNSFGGEQELWTLTEGEDTLRLLRVIEGSGIQVIAHKMGTILLFGQETQITLDRGASWISTGVPLNPIQASEMGNVFAFITNDSVFQFSPLETRLTNLRYPVPLAKMRSIFFSNDTLYVGSDLGLHARGESGEWRDLTIDLPESEVVAINRIDNELVVLTNSSSYVSSDNGENWDEIQGGAYGAGFAGSQAGGLTLRGDSLLAYNKQGVWIRGTGGNWTEYNRGLRELTTNEVYANEGRILAAVEKVGLMFSDDFGGTWNSSSGVPTQAQVHSMLRAPDGHLLSSTHDHGVYRSTDRGTTWLPSTDGLLTSATLELKRFGDTIFSHAYDNTFITTNSGESWRLVELPDTMRWIRTSYRTPTSWLFGGFSGLWEKPDGVDEWTQVLPSTVLDIVTAGRNVLAVGQSGAMISFQGTGDWNPINSPGQIRSYLELNPDVAYAGTTSGLKVSLDEGWGWQNTQSEIDNEFILDLEFDSANKSVIVSVKDGGLYRFALPASVSRENISITQLTAYPNPTADRITISIGETTGKTSIEVIDMRGIVHLTSEVQPEDGEVTLDVSSVASGSYLAMIKQADGTVALASFVKQ